MTITILQEDCDPGVATDKSLPYTAYLVTYEKEGKEHYDLTIAQKEVDMFDYYYDKYKKGFKTFKQADGLANPKLWGNKQAAPPKKKRKKKPPQEDG